VYTFALIDDEANIKKWVVALNAKLRHSRRDVSVGSSKQIEKTYEKTPETELDSDPDTTGLSGKELESNLVAETGYGEQFFTEVERRAVVEASLRNSLYHDSWSLDYLEGETRVFYREDDRSSTDISRWIDCVLGPMEIKAQCCIQCSADDVFKFAMDLNRSSRTKWDTSLLSGKVIETVDEYHDVIMLKYKNDSKFVRSGGEIQLHRTWRRESDGTFKILYMCPSEDEEKKSIRKSGLRLQWSYWTVCPKVSSFKHQSCVVTVGSCYDAFGLVNRLYALSGSLARRIFVQPLDSLRQLVESDEHIGLVKNLDAIGNDKSSLENENLVEQSIESDKENLDYHYYMPENNYIFPQNISKDGTSCWWDSGVEEGFWNIRGKNYLEDRKKIPSTLSAMELVQQQWSFYDDPVRNIANDPASLVQKQHEGKTGRPFLVIINFMVPTIGNWVCYFAKRRGVDYERFNKMLDEFIEGDDEFRNSKFKIIPNVVEGSYFASRAIGSKPAILGTKITTEYYKGDNWFEVCVDVGSSRVAGTLMGVVKSYATSLVIDLAFLFESQSYEELPEVILGGCRIEKPLMYKCDDVLDYVKSREHLEKALGPQ